VIKIEPFYSIYRFYVYNWSRLVFTSSERCIKLGTKQEYKNKKRGSQVNHIFCIYCKYHILLLIINVTSSPTSRTELPSLRSYHLVFGLPIETYRNVLWRVDVSLFCGWHLPHRLAVQRSGQR